MSDAPAPLTPPNCDLRDFQYMELDVRRLRDSEFSASVTGEAFRAGVLLWCAAWHQVPAASLPDNDTELSNLAGFGRVIREWKRVREQALNGFIKCSDGRLYHAVIAEKALSAFKAKENHAYARFCDRMRKENKARENDGKPQFGIPTIEQWKSGAYPHGIPPEPPATSDGIPPEIALRGNGEGTEREQSLISVPDGTGGMAAKPVAGLTDSELWWAAKSLLHSQDMPKPQCGAFIGKLAKDFTSPVALDAIRATLAANPTPANASEYLKGCCMHAAGQRHMPNRQEALEASNRAVVKRMLEKESTE